jgi:hypothetical protein
MADIVYLYPKTSCPIEECKKSYPIPVNYIETNLGVENGVVSPYFDCYNRVEISSDINPQKQIGIYEINPQCYEDKISPDFGKVPWKTPPCCPDVNYLSNDPRLLSTTRSDYLTLDRPPMNGKVKLKDIYDKKYDAYGTGFTPYNKIKDGDISYYVDKSVQGAFYEPVFSEPSTETLVMYQDPMGSLKPEANRKQINNFNPTVTTVKEYPYCLSFIQDTQSFREDIMGYQQRKNNQSKWTVRWPIK